MESDLGVAELCASVVAFCEATIQAVRADSSEDMDKDCLLEMLEFSIKYLELIKDYMDDVADVQKILFEILVEFSNDQDARERAMIKKGRPKVLVEKEQLVYLRECGFRMKDIAAIFGCSKRTIERRMSEFNIPRQCDVYSSLTDSQLDQKMSQIVSLFPMCGQKSVDGLLKAEGVRVCRRRIRESLQRVDPFGIECRARRVLRRRTYSVQSPNDLWHIDGYHKLVRWKIVIHGGIDGFSRLIMFLKASTNNRADTMFQAFQEGVADFGLPSRIRMDKGGENTLVAQYILEHPNRGSGCAIVGRSVHNQRIERLWRDLFAGCISFFYHFFYFLEDCGLLNIEDGRDVYALHQAFVEVIQEKLNSFRLGWSNHGLRTERGKNPMQLWVAGLLQARASTPEHTAVSGIGEDFEHPELELDGPISLEVEDTVIVEAEDLLSTIQKDMLRQELAQCDASSHEGLVSMFSLAKLFVHECLSTQ